MSSLHKKLPKIDTSQAENFIDPEKIWALINDNKNPSSQDVTRIIQKSLNKQRLEMQEMAILLNCEDPTLISQIFDGARQLKQRIYGNRIVLFAPLYIGNECVNNCKYCGFRKNNAETIRRTLTYDELAQEVTALENDGHKRLILVYGEHPMYDPFFIAETVKRTYDTKTKNGEIRRVNINAAPLDVEGFKIVKDAGIGTYQIFMETYHQPTYEAMHPNGPKSNYLWRLSAFDRAMQAGIDDVGLGALIGLYDWRFEALSLLAHTIHLEKKFNIGPHTISFPRIESAIGTELTEDPKYKISDDEFKRLVAILRLAVPYTGLILTCRESTELRNEMLSFGISQIDGGSSIGIGSYSQRDKEAYKRSQFVLADNRSLDEIIHELCQANHIPSFCTACYRMGRTGEHFMEFAIPGFVKQFCQPNAILTFLEYLNDYATPTSLESGLKCIEKEIEKFNDDKQKKALLDRIKQIKDGKRDLYF
ncbi:MAG: [FeFe] hydrogenase H-cluster radical SAM maturase HydG [Lentisphaeria bacterium]